MLVKSIFAENINIVTSLKKNRCLAKYNFFILNHLSNKMYLRQIFCRLTIAQTLNF